MDLVKLGPSKKKQYWGRLFIQEGTGAEKERYKDSRKEGQEMGKGIVVSYKWGEIGLPVRQPALDHGRWSRTVRQIPCS